MSFPSSAWLWTLAALGLAGCAPPLSHGDSAQLAACRARAEQVYSVQNRGEVYLQDGYASGARDAPFAGATGFAATNAEVTGRFRREEMVERCMRGSAGNVGSTPVDAPDPTQPRGDRGLPPPVPASATHLPTPEPLAVPPKP